MNSIEPSRKDIFERFKDKLEELKETLPSLGDVPGNSCAANTLDNILDVLNIKDSEKHYFHNLAVPFSGFGAYQTRGGWKGPCGVVSGAIAGIGIIMGGHEQTNRENVPLVFTKALRFCDKFEQKYGSLNCLDLCGHDQSKEYRKYVEDKVWEKICHQMVIYAIEIVMKLTKKDLKTKWL
jgi:C_GCAxxG_C_C family probable redox protein